MHAYEIQHVDEDFEGVVRTERPDPTPAAAEALVRIDACSLNYRDLMIASTDFGYPGEEYPMIPLSDGAGEVVEIGEAVTSLSAGDRVATPFAPDWHAGPPSREKVHRSTGGNLDGTLAEYVTFRAESLTPVPEHLSDAEAGSLSCAGLTAWRALVEDGDLRAGETVLCLGTGGVSTFALQFATMFGARPIVTSSSDEKRERAQELGAWETLNYEDTPEWGEAVRELTDGEGVDHVVEVGGVGTLERSLEAVAVDGQVHQIGVLTGPAGGIDPAPIMGKSVTLNGVLGVGSQAMFERMTDAIEVNRMTPYVDRTFDFEDAREAYRYARRGEHQGKVAIEVE